MVGGMAIDITERIKIEEALRESESRFRHMADHVPALIWVTERESCDYVNREYLRFLGRPLEGVWGANWAEFVHPSEWEDYVSGFRRAVAACVPFGGEFRFRRHDGEYRWMRSVGVPRFTADGSLIGYVGCSVDIEDAKRASENLHAV
jgi:PAS domain S-box-containing protein